MKNLASFLLSVGAICIWLLCGCGRPGPTVDLDYLAEVSGVWVPSNVQDILIQYPTEFCMAGRLIVPADKIEDFINRNRLTTIDNLPLSRDFALDAGDLTRTASVLGMVGRSAKNRWELTFDPKTGRLWFVLLFEDMAGDAPG